MRALGWLISLESGGRLGELVNIRFVDVRDVVEAGPNENGTYLIVSNGKTKEVELEFSELTAAAVRRWILMRPHSRSKRLFVTSKRMRNSNGVLEIRGLHSRSFQTMLAKLCNEAGVRPIFPHSLRHRAGDRITRVYGAKIAQMKLNHRDVKTVLDFYHHPNRTDVNRATVSLSPLVAVQG